MRRGIRLVLLLFLLCVSARADGPHIALHASEGGHTATLFTAPDPLVAGKVEFALLVQDAEGGPMVPVRSARVVLRLAREPGVEVELTPGANGSRELLGGSAIAARAGEYRLEVTVVDARGTVARFTGALPVAENHGRRDVVLFGTLIPLALALLFLVNQHAKQRLRTGRTS